MRREDAAPEVHASPIPSTKRVGLDGVTDPTTAKARIEAFATGLRATYRHVAQTRAFYSGPQADAFFRDSAFAVKERQAARPNNGMNIALPETHLIGIAGGDEATVLREGLDRSVELAGTHKPEGVPKALAEDLCRRELQIQVAEAYKNALEAQVASLEAKAAEIKPANPNPDNMSGMNQKQKRAVFLYNCLTRDVHSLEQTIQAIDTQKTAAETAKAQAVTAARDQDPITDEQIDATKDIITAIAGTPECAYSIAHYADLCADGHRYTLPSSLAAEQRLLSTTQDAEALNTEVDAIDIDPLNPKAEMDAINTAATAVDDGRASYKQLLDFADQLQPDTHREVNALLDKTAVLNDIDRLNNSPVNELPLLRDALQELSTQFQAAKAARQALIDVYEKQTALPSLSSDENKKAIKAAKQKLEAEFRKLDRMLNGQRNETLQLACAMDENAQYLKTRLRSTYHLRNAANDAGSFMGDRLSTYYKHSAFGPWKLVSMPIMAAGDLATAPFQVAYHHGGKLFDSLSDWWKGTSKLTAEDIKNNPALLHQMKTQEVGTVTFDPKTGKKIGKLSDSQGKEVKFTLAKTAELAREFFRKYGMSEAEIAKRITYTKHKQPDGSTKLGLNVICMGSGVGSGMRGVKKDEEPPLTRKKWHQFLLEKRAEAQNQNNQNASVTTSDAAQNNTAAPGQDATRPGDGQGRAPFDAARNGQTAEPQRDSQHIAAPNA